MLKLMRSACLGVLFASCFSATTSNATEIRYTPQEALSVLEAGGDATDLISFVLGIYIQLGNKCSQVAAACITFPFDAAICDSSLCKTNFSYDACKQICDKRNTCITTIVNVLNFVDMDFVGQ